MRDVSTKLADLFNKAAVGGGAAAGMSPLLMAAAMSGSSSLLATLLDQERVKKQADLALHIAKLEALLKGSASPARKKTMKKEPEVDVVGMLMDISDTLFKGSEGGNQPEKAVQAEALTRR